MAVFGMSTKIFNGKDSTWHSGNNTQKQFTANRAREKNTGERGKERYNKKAKMMFKPMTPTLEIKKKEGLVFKRKTCKAF